MFFNVLWFQLVQHSHLNSFQLLMSKSYTRNFDDQFLNRPLSIYENFSFHISKWFFFQRIDFSYISNPGGHTGLDEIMKYWKLCYILPVWKSPELNLNHPISPNHPISLKLLDHNRARSGSERPEWPTDQGLPEPRLSNWIHSSTLDHFSWILAKFMADSRKNKSLYDILSKMYTHCLVMFYFHHLLINILKLRFYTGIFERKTH